MGNVLNSGGIIALWNLSLIKKNGSSDISSDAAVM